MTYSIDRGIEDPFENGVIMWISVIAVGVILGAILLKDRENKKQPAYIPVKVKDPQSPKR